MISFLGRSIRLGFWLAISLFVFIDLLLPQLWFRLRRSPTQLCARSPSSTCLNSLDTPRLSFSFYCIWSALIIYRHLEKGHVVNQLWRFVTSFVSRINPFRRLATTLAPRVLPRHVCNCKLSSIGFEIHSLLHSLSPLCVCCLVAIVESVRNRGALNADVLLPDFFWH